MSRNSGASGQAALNAERLRELRRKKEWEELDDASDVQQPAAGEDRGGWDEEGGEVAQGEEKEAEIGGDDDGGGVVGEEMRPGFSRV